MNSPRILKAIEFGRAAHDSITQKRKYTGEPYWVHTEEVAKTLWGIGEDENVTIAAVLHDIKEDVFPKNPSYTDKDIIEKFGTEVLQLVNELTNVYTTEAYPNLNRYQRHILENGRLAQISPEGQTIKISDLISNTKDLVKQDPGFAKVYLAEKLVLLPLLRKGNEKLFLRAYNQILAALDENNWRITIRENPKITLEEPTTR